MPLRRCLIAGLALLWAGVFVVPLGTHLQTQSPRFDEFEHQFYAKIIAANRGQDLGPNMFSLVFSWVFVGGFCLFIGVLFTGGACVVRSLVARRRVVGLLLAGVFGLGCFMGTLLGLGEAVESFRWSFTVLGVGYLLSAAGLGLGAIGVMGNCLSSREI